MKKILTVFALLLISFVSQSQTTFYSVNNDGDSIHYRVVDTSVHKVCVIAHWADESSSYKDTLNIPSHVTGSDSINYEVSQIGEYAFLDCWYLYQVNMPNTITEILQNAFDQTGLTSLTLPASIDSLGAYAFICDDLEYIICEAIVPPKTCGSLRFNDDVNDTMGFHIPVFVPCDSRVTYDTITGCSWYDFVNYQCITYNMTNQYNDTIYYSITNNNEIDIMSNILLGQACYENTGCYSDSIYLPDSILHRGMCYPVTGLGYMSLSYNSDLTYVQLPFGLKYIGNSAFESSNNLQTLHLPNTVDSIGDFAFENSGINILILDAVTPPNVSQNTFSSMVDTLKVYVPCGSIGLYKNAQYWSSLNIMNCIGLDDIDDNSIKIYPNPVTDKITIEGYVGDVIICNSIGNIVKQVNNINIIDVSDLQSGIYVVKFGNINKKIVIK